MNAPKPAVIILDFDGVIVESNAIKDEAMLAAFADYPQHKDEIMVYHRRHTAVIRFEKFEYITRKILKQPYTALWEKTLSRRFSQFVLERMKDCPLVAGAKEFLDYFSARMPLYLASINPADDLRAILKMRGLDRYFKQVYASPWDKRAAMLEILKAESLSPKEAVFIGDTMEDYQAARTADVFFVARQGQCPFPKGIPVFPDLFAVKEFLKDR